MIMIVQVAEKYREHAWFISFAPVDNPKIALAVFIEHGAAGSSVAGPVARRILDAYLLDDEGELKSEYRFPQISEEGEEVDEAIPAEGFLSAEGSMVGAASGENINALSENDRQLATFNE